MKYKVTDWEQDVAGKFRYRVVIGDSSVVFKFQEFPTDEEVQEVAARYDAIMQEQADAIADEGSITDA
ncbi:MAG TPA: hypothetical protein VLA24_13825 [Pseudomonadales bacterium]|nr:hypothetical protein [Pseudomonadales bacterium]